MEAKVRSILRGVLSPRRNTRGLGSRIHARFEGIGGAELDIPERDGPPRAVEFE